MTRIYDILLGLPKHRFRNMKDLTFYYVLPFRYFRMSPDRFNHLLSLVEPLIKKSETKFRKPISAGERLAVTLRFLATGDSQQTLSYSFRMGKATVSKIVSETCDAIYAVLKEKYLSPPKCRNDWLNISKQFEETWNMPHAIGCIDGKHIRIECPKLSGTLYYNYKGFFSIVLLAICDARYCFSLFDLGQYGSNNDSGILKNSQMGNMFEDDLLNVPPDSKLHKDDTKTCPYFLLGDEIFPLKKWLMRPFPGKSATEEERIYNYRQSRARRVIENCFGILSARFRILQKPIRASVENVEKFVLACLALHNYLRLTDNAHYTPAGFIDSEDRDGNFIPGEWRSQNGNTSAWGNFQNINPVRGSRPRVDALNVRNQLKDYLNSDEGSVPWQLDYIRRTSHYAV